MLNLVLQFFPEDLGEKNLSNKMQKKIKVLIFAAFYFTMLARINRVLAKKDEPMKLPNFPKLGIPKWIRSIKLPHLKMPTFFNKGEYHESFYDSWRRFLRQIPPESRPAVNSYQHFIVLGSTHSGKTDLINGLIEQSEDLYPFDTSYKQAPDIQFYLGPNQLIQEISFPSLEDRSIKTRRQTIRLWKKLYARRDPIVIITYNCFSKENQNLRELNRLAQLIAGKISLLSEITKKPLKVRIALTHLDKMPGYLEFARFLKQENLNFNINLSSNFESNTLAVSLKKFFEEHLNLMLTSVSDNDFAKMLTFSKEMPGLFQPIEEFLRALVTRVSFANSIQLDTLSLTANQESSTSFNPFHWVRHSSMEIFFRYPMLKHQLAASALCAVLASSLIYFYALERKELNLTYQGVEQLNLLQYDAFLNKTIPAYVKQTNSDPKGLVKYLIPHFFGSKLDNAKNNLANRIQKRYIDIECHKAILENNGELKCLYFTGLLNATRDNLLGRFILSSSQEMAKALNMDEGLIIAYINSCTQPGTISFDPVNANPILALTSFAPWLDFLKTIQTISTQSIFMEHDFASIVKEADKLLKAVDVLKENHLPFPIATLLEEQLGDEYSPESVKVIRWIGHNIDTLSNYLHFIKLTSTAPIDDEQLNIAQFFTKIQNVSAMTSRENQKYNLSLKNELFSLETKQWVDLVVAHNVERAIQHYIVANNNTKGAIFFRNTFEPPHSMQPVFNGIFPFFANSKIIPGRYTRLEYEGKVRATAEKLAHLIESLAVVNPEEKRRFKTFLIQEVVNYVRQFQDHYVSYFNSCDMKDASIDKVKNSLKELSCESSGFFDLISYVQFQTAGFHDPILNKKINELNHFEFLDSLITVNGGEAPYSQYQRLIAELYHDLESEKTLKSSYFHQRLKPYLTTVAAISSDILQDNSRSYLQRAIHCLNKLGVPSEYQYVFLKPIVQIRNMGVNDLREGIENAWVKEFKPKIEHMLTKFPFDFKSKEVASREEINDLFNPRGEFYQALTAVISSCAKLNEGEWSPLDSSSISLSRDIYTTLNQVQSIVNTLWDKEGQPHSINIAIKPVPFIHSGDDNSVILRSYLSIGDQLISNINQAPVWQNIKFDWWQDMSSAVGVELMNTSSTSKSYKSVLRPASLWGVLELLKEASAKDDNIMTWKVPGEGNKSYDISFAFQNDPWKLLGSATQEN